MDKQKKPPRSMIDMSIMHDVFGDNPAAILKFLQRFIEISSALLKDTGVAIQEKNKLKAMNDIHQLKGVAGSIGFKKMNLLCEKIQVEVTKENWTSAKELCDEMEIILKKFQIYLQNKY